MTVTATTVLDPPAPVGDQTLIVATVLPSRGVLGRVAAVLAAHRVASLAYRTAPVGPATVEVTVPAADSARVRAKLLRMVDVLEVLSAPRA